MKPPDDPTPSGDRTMARAFKTALERAGHSVTLASRLRTHLRAPDPARQSALAAAAEDELERLATIWKRDGAPDLWFTYHNYHKAPDLLGPPLTRRFDLPYALAEASHAPRRVEAWTTWFAAAERATRAADLLVCLTERDRAGIEPLAHAGSRMLDLPPFLDLEGVPPPPAARPDGPVRLVTVAMMRPGDKLDSYRFLAEALSTIPSSDWQLAIVGSGAARPDVEAAFNPLPALNLRWHGMLDPPAIRRCLSEAQLFVWPGFGEAFGLAYLEAQAIGLPVVALDVAGVSSVVEADRTGLLVSAPTPATFGAAITTLIEDWEQRERLGRQAADFVRNERSLTAAARRLDRALQALAAA
jgi:glycosyltransferase involved in cell wall biosynthesis